MGRKKTKINWNPFWGVMLFAGLGAFSRADVDISVAFTIWTCLSIPIALLFTLFVNMVDR